MDRFDRIFELNRILQSARHPVSRRRLQEELECSRATVKRIIDDMRLYVNAPIVYDRERNGYCYDQREGEMYELPGLWFNASELHALLSVQQLLASVQPGLLDSHLKPLHKRIDELLRLQHAGSDGLSGRIRILQMAAREVGESFQVVAGALAQRVRLRLSYFNRASEEYSEREVSPQRLTYYRDNWYLDAWCHLRNGLRTFALDAVGEAWVLDAAIVEVPDDELDAHFASSYGIFAGTPRHVAVLRFDPRRARWVAKERWHRDQEGRFLVDGSYELKVPYSNALELIMDVLKYGPDVEVLAPEHLRREVAERMRAALLHY
ncbi:MAG: WYL domain-containing protein [Pseudomonadota bacterium]|nr:WYL domain-containing protein [Pseudomonadota bacterium]